MKTSLILLLLAFAGKDVVDALKFLVVYFKNERELDTALMYAEELQRIAGSSDALVIRIFLFLFWFFFLTAFVVYNKYFYRMIAPMF